MPSAIRKNMGRVHNIADLRELLMQAESFRIKSGRPFIVISYAQSVDGSIAAGDKTQLHLSGPRSLLLTHNLRAACDAILVGINTVLVDNPRLTVRLSRGDNPQPVVLDTRLRIPLDCRLIQRNDLNPWVVGAKNNSSRRKSALRLAGARVLPCETAADGRIDLCALMRILAEMEINSIMVEGGARVITSFINAKLVDQFIITIAPKLVGGLQVIDAQGLKARRCLQLGCVAYESLGEDIILWANPVWSV